MRLEFKDIVLVSYNSEAMLSHCTGKVLRHPEGPMGLEELSLQHWFGLILQRGFLHDCKKNGLFMETHQNLLNHRSYATAQWNMLNHPHSSASPEKFILVSLCWSTCLHFCTLASDSQWENRFFLSVWVPIDSVVEEESKCFPNTKCSIW